MLDLGQTLVLDFVALELPLLLVEEVIELHHLFLSVLVFGLELVALPQCPQLLLFDLDGELVEHLGEGSDSLVEGDGLA